MINDEHEDIIGSLGEPRIKWARSEGFNLWKKHGGGTVPFDPVQIIQSLGIHLKEEELTMDGVSRVDANGLMFIMYKKNCAPVRKRFTLAHELGHIILEHVNIGSSSQHSTNSQEIEANHFANALLVPADDLKKFMKQSFRQLHDVQQRYDVSKDVAFLAVKENKLFTRLRSTAAALHIM